jgi:hypothetical protein
MGLEARAEVMREADIVKLPSSKQGIHTLAITNIISDDLLVFF